jgi:arylsulfatase A-like enzyme
MGTARQVDVAPTFLSLAGLDPTDTVPPMDGKSIAHKLIDPTDLSVPLATATSVRWALSILEAVHID